MNPLKRLIKQLADEVKELTDKYGDVDFGIPYDWEFGNNESTYTYGVSDGCVYLFKDGKPRVLCPFTSCDVKILARMFDIIEEVRAGRMMIKRRHT